MGSPVQQREKRRRDVEDRLLEVRPDPNVVRFVSWAIEAVAPKLGDDAGLWREWAAAWQEGRRQPATCVDVAQWCFAHEARPAFHALGQIAWAAKEACYSTPTSAWLVLRYIGDAMLAFQIAIPEDAQLLFLPSPDAQSHISPISGQK